MKNNQPPMSLYNHLGQRKYMITQERRRYFEICQKRDLPKRLFLLMLYHSGARIAEVLNLQVTQIDAIQNMVIVESLKKRRKCQYRSIPLPNDFINSLKHLIQHQKNQNTLWDFSLRSASRYVKSVMKEAHIVGPFACSRGLRHSFAVNAVEHDVPLNLIQRWMGHSSISTTAIYLNVMGQEERRFAEKMWTK